MNSKKKIYSAVIIGAGRIGAGFDSPKSKYILTHAHAIARNPRVKLVAFVDTNAKQGKKEAERWNTKFFKSAEELFKHERPDIVVIATPDATHVSFLEKLSKYKPKLIICEKPVATTRKALAKVKKLRLPPVVVNYSRRFDETVWEVKKDLARGRYGKIIAAHGVYTGDLIHNGSHLVDLARFLIGDKTKVSLVAGDARAYSLFELNILASEARIRFVDGGQRLIIERAQKDPVYAGFRTLRVRQIKKTKLSQALPNLYRHAVEVLSGKERPFPNLKEALQSEATLL